MGPRGSEIDDQPTADDMPEDVAALYSWANLQGAKYRDYSASRREQRAQARYRAARAMLENELRAQVEAEAAAARVEAMTAQRLAGLPVVGDVSASVSNGETARLAAAERVEAARRAESAARAAVLALREEREIAEAHSSAKRQAQIYEESEARRRLLAGPQPHWPLGSGQGSEGDLLSDAAGFMDQLQPASEEMIAKAHVRDPDQGMQLFDSDSVNSQNNVEGVHNAPAWLSSGQAILRPQVDSAASQTYRAELAPRDTLQDSRERVASRWFALKDVFDQAGPELPAMQPIRARADQRPLLAVFSLSGGVGKTSLLATLARALSAEGEKVALVDTTSQGLLPIYFGAEKGRRRGLIEPQQPQDDVQDSVSLFLHDSQRHLVEEYQGEDPTEQILRSAQGTHRILIDLATGSNSLIRRLVDLHPVVLVPVSPDMNSVISMRSIERLFRGVVDSEGRSLLPFYLLNQFDAALPLHLDVREVLRRQLGDRLLPYTIRRSPLVSEALADGMTVLEYAPEGTVTQEYRTVAKWLRSVSPPATQEMRGEHRGER